MPDLDITAFDPHVYDVTITDQSGVKTEHCGTVPERLVRDLGIAASQEPALVRASMTYLLECDSASSVMAAFTLDDITRPSGRQGSLAERTEGDRRRGQVSPRVSGGTATG